MRVNKISKITASDIAKGTTYHMQAFTRPTRKSLNIDKIKTLDDVKRVLKFLDITANVGNGITQNGYGEVKDLFE